MSRWVVTALAACLLTLVVSPVSAAEKENWFSNGDLELGDFDPEGWDFPDKASWKYKMSWEEGNAPSGNRCLKIGEYVYTNKWAYLSFSPHSWDNLIPIAQNQTYILTFKYKVDPSVWSNSFHVRIQYWKEKQLLEDTYEHMENPPDWADFELLVRDHVPGATHIRLFFALTTCRGYAWLDDVVWRAATDEDIRRIRLNETLSPAEAPPMKKAAAPVIGKATGYYHPQKLDGIWWMINPKGRAYFETGLGRVVPPNPWREPQEYVWLHSTYSPGRDWKKTGSRLAALYSISWNRLTDEQKKEIAKIEKLNKPGEQAWSQLVINRMLDMNCSYISGEVHHKNLIKRAAEGKPSMPFTIIVPGPDWAGGNKLIDRKGKAKQEFPDPWNREWIKGTKKLLAERWPAESTKNPLFLGAYISNEIDFRLLWDAHYSPDASREFISFLTERYNGNIKALCKAWKTRGARRKYKTFKDILKKKPEPVSWEDPMMNDMLAWERKLMQKFVKEYYTMTSEAYPGHMVMSNRYHPGGYADALRSMDMMSVFDAVCFNLYPASWRKGLSRGEINIFRNLNAVTDRPVILTEWSIAAREERKNGMTRFTRCWVDTQADRAQAYRTCMSQLFAMPYMIGADWFTWFNWHQHWQRRVDDRYLQNLGMFRYDCSPYQPLVDTVKKVNAIAAQPVRTTGWHWGY